MHAPRSTFWKRIHLNHINKYSWRFNLDQNLPRTIIYPNPIRPRRRTSSRQKYSNDPSNHSRFQRNRAQNQPWQPLATEKLAGFGASPLARIGEFPGTLGIGNPIEIAPNRGCREPGIPRPPTAPGLHRARAPLRSDPETRCCRRIAGTRTELTRRRNREFARLLAASRPNSFFFRIRGRRLGRWSYEWALRVQLGQQPSIDVTTRPAGHARRGELDARAFHRCSSQGV
jgi:hypothetical protein